MRNWYYFGDTGGREGAREKDWAGHGEMGCFSSSAHVLAQRLTKITEATTLGNLPAS